MKGNTCNQQINYFLQGKVLFAPINKQEERCFVVAAIEISKNEKYIAMIYQINSSQFFLQIWDLESQLSIFNQQYGIILRISIKYTIIHREIKISFSGDSEVIGINQRYRPERCALINFLKVKSKEQTELEIPDFDSLISSELTINYTGNKCIIHQYDYFFVFNSIWDNKNYYYSYSRIQNIRGYDVTIRFSNFFDNFYLFLKGQAKLELWTCYKNNKVKQTCNYFDSYLINDLKEMEQNKQLLVHYQKNNWSTNTIIIIYLPKFSIIRKILLREDGNNSDLLTLFPRTDLIIQLKHNQRKRVDDFIFLKQKQDIYQETCAKLIFTLPEVKVLYAPIFIQENSFIVISKNHLLQVIKDRIEIYSFKEFI